VDKDLEKAKYFVKTFIPVEFEKLETDVEIMEENQTSLETEMERPITKLVDTLEKSDNLEEISNKLNAISSPEPLDVESYQMQELRTPNFFRNDTLISIDFEETFKIACVRGFATSVASQHTHP
jgi:hypothetical protein